MYSDPRAVVTKYYKLNDLKQEFLLTVLEARNSVGGVGSFSRLWGRTCSMLPCYSEEVPSHPRCSPTARRLRTPMTASTFFWTEYFLCLISVSLLQMTLVSLRTLSTPVRPHLTSIASATILFSNEITFWGSGKDLNLRGTLSNPCLLLLYKENKL